MIAARSFMARVGRVAFIFGASHTLTTVIGLGLTAYVTRQLTPAQYGQLGLILLLSSFTMILYGLGVLTGTNSLVFGSAMDDEAGIDDDIEELADEDEATKIKRELDPRKALGTGISLTILTGTIGTGIVYLFRVPLAQALAGNASQTGVIMWAAVGGVTSAVWRISSNFQRYAQRPFGYLCAHNARAVFAGIAVFVLVQDGQGINGVVIGWTVGALVAAIVILIAMRHDYRPWFSWRGARQIYRHGRAFIPVSMSLWTIQNADVYLLSLFTTTTQVGIFRVASSISRLSSYAVSSFTLAWGPLTNTPLYAAVLEEEGPGRTGGALITGFLVIGAWVLLGFALFADVLVRIAPATYASAAPLIPVLAAVPLARGLYSSAYRSSGRRDKRRWFVWVAVAGCALFLILACTLTPAIGSMGMAISENCGLGFMATVTLLLARKGDWKLEIRWRDIVLSAVLSGALYGVHRYLDPIIGSDAGLVLDAVLLAGFWLLLAAFGVIHLSIAGATVQVVEEAGAGTIRKKDLRRRLPTLSHRELVLLRSAIVHHEELGVIGDWSGEDEETVAKRFIDALRKLGDVDPAAQCNPEITEYLLQRGVSAAQHRMLGVRLVSAGNDPLALDRLDRVTRRLRKLPPRKWPRGIDDGLLLVASPR